MSVSDRSLFSMSGGLCVGLTTYDAKDPDTKFPAENPSSCPDASITTLSYDWTTLGSQITAMQPNGSTNQGIGVSHGWQMLTTGAPYNTPTVPEDVTRYIILLSDGLNTQNRWWGDGSTEGTTEDGYIDDHEKAASSL